MSKTPSTGVLFAIARKFRKLAGHLVEKPSNKVDEYVLEHILLYHGLVGSQEENQRQYRDVRADIIEAVNEQSSLNLAIALKLPPLWWDSKLATIFAEIAETKRKEAIATFLPEDKKGDMASNAQPLKHEDWRVRANAAGVLAYLQAEQAIPHLVAALDDTADSVKPAFCHIAYALGQLKGATARKTLVDYLFDAEAWTRVDAARALVLFDRQDVATDLAKAMLSHHKLSDYMAVVIGKVIAPRYFIDQPNDTLKQGGLEMVISIIEASRQTFSTDIVTETNTHGCWSFLSTCLANNPTPQELRAAYCLTQWLSANKSQLSDQAINEIVERQPQSTADSENHSALLSAQVLEIENKISRDNYGAYLVGQLKEHASDKEQSQLRHILFMIAALRVTDALPELSKLLTPDAAIIDCVIDCLGVIGDNKTGLSLVALANDLVDFSGRTDKDKVSQPVEEDKPQAAATYWCILKALSGLPSDDSAQFLLAATNDFAPDKRAQALASLLAIQSKLPDNSALRAKLKEKLIEALNDPSTQMKTLALSGVADLDMVESLNKITRFADASEVSLRRQAFAALEQLSQNGHKQEVESAVKAKLKSEFDKFKRKRLDDFLQSL